MNRQRLIEAIVRTLNNMRALLQPTERFKEIHQCIDGIEAELESADDETLSNTFNTSFGMWAQMTVIVVGRQIREKYLHALQEA